MGKSSFVLLVAIWVGGCSTPTLPITPSPVAGTLVVHDSLARNGYPSPPFDPARRAVADARGVVVTGFVPGDMCRAPMSASYSRVGSRLVVTLTRVVDGGRPCLAWIAETRYTVTLRGLEMGRYDVFVVEKLVPESGVTQVDTFAVGAVNERSRQ